LIIPNAAGTPQIVTILSMEQENKHMGFVPIPSAENIAHRKCLKLETDLNFEAIRFHSPFNMGEFLHLLIFES
jgi:hypothetical protein